MPSITWDRKATSIASFMGNGMYRFAVLPNYENDPQQSDIVCGLTHTGGEAPQDLRHAVMVRGEQFCIVEDGQQITEWLDCPTYSGQVQAVVFRIYRIAGRVLYTVSSAPESAYTEDGWEDGLWRDGDTEHQFDFDPYAPTSLDGLTGELVHQGAARFAGEAFLAAAFSRLPYDIYGDLGNGRIFAALAFSLSDTVAASIPPIEGFIGDVNEGVYGGIPALDGYAADFDFHGVRTSIPALQLSSSEGSPFDVELNYVSAEIPALKMAVQEGVLYGRIPVLKSRSGDWDAVHGKLPFFQVRIGDELEGVFGYIPALSGRSVEEQSQADSVHGAIGIYLGVQVQSYVTDPSHLPTEPLVALSEIDGTVYGENPLGTAPLKAIASISVKPYREAVLPTQPLEAKVSIQGAIYAERWLGAVPMTAIVGGEGALSGILTLQTEPMVALLSGRIGQYSAKQAVYVLDAGSGATTQYGGFSFSSFATINGKHYGTNEDGLFLLDGDTDEGQPIDAEFGYGELDFGTAKMKTMSYSYLGTDAGRMKMRVQSHIDGREFGQDYHARCHRVGVREVRFDLGRGLKSTYIMPTFYNANGDDFEVDNVRFLIAASARRI